MIRRLLLALAEYVGRAQVSELTDEARLGPDTRGGSMTIKAEHHPACNDGCVGDDHLLLGDDVAEEQ